MPSTPWSASLLGGACLLVISLVACSPAAPTSGGAANPPAPPTAPPAAAAPPTTAPGAASPATKPAAAPSAAVAASPAPATSPVPSAAAAAPSGPAPVLTAAQVPAAVKSACQPAQSPRIADIQKRGELGWGIGVSPPFGFKQPTGEWAGVEADNAKELANILGVKETIQDFDYSLMPTALQSNQVDIVGAQLFITPVRQQAIDFTHPYYLSGQLFYVLESSKWQTIDDLNSPDNRFVYGTGGGQKDLADKYIPKAKISDAPLRGQLLLYEFLASGQADSSMTEAAPLKVLRTQYRNPQLAAIGLKGRITTERAANDEILDPFQVAFGIAKGDPGFAACANAWVDDALQSGRMQQRLDYWLAQNIGG